MIAKQNLRLKKQKKNLVRLLRENGNKSWKSVCARDKIYKENGRRKITKKKLWKKSPPSPFSMY